MKLSNKNQKEHHEKYKGKEVEVLFEEEKNGFYQGHTKNYIVSLINSKENLENKILKAKCIKAENDHILLEIPKCNKSETNM